MKKNKDFLTKVVIIIFFVSVITWFWQNKKLSQQQSNKIGDTNKTEIIKYKQTYIPKNSKKGICWNGAIATGNTMAWRCMTDISIYDPCFETESGQIVCDVEPENNKSGFELKPTEDLPEQFRNTGIDENFPWYIKLQDGTICRPLTGTGLHINNEFAYHYCSKNNMYLLSGEDGYSTFDKSGEYWKVRAVIYSGAEEFYKEIPVEEINITKVWE